MRAGVHAGVPARVERECKEVEIFNMAAEDFPRKRSPRAIKFNK